MALDSLTAGLVALAFVSPHTLDLETLVAPRALPILAVAAVQTALGLHRRIAWRCLLGTACAAAATAISVRPVGAGSHQGPLAFHLALAAVVLVGAAFDDRVGRSLRTMAAAMVILGSLVAISGHFERTGAVPEWMIQIYPLVMAMLIAGYGLVLGHRISITSAWLIVSFWLAVMGLSRLHLAPKGCRGPRLYLDRHGALGPGSTDEHGQGTCNAH